MKLDYLLLISCILVVVALVLYLFYWNRLIAYAISLGLRVWGWGYGGSSVWIEFRAIHISLLAGRILLKDLKYHSSDITVIALKCQFSWRYWIRRPMDERDLGHSRVISGESDDTVKNPNMRPPCRVHISLQGVRCYMHNRTAAFDNIVNEMESQASATNPPQSGGPGHSGVTMNRMFSKSSIVRTGVASEATPLYPPSSLALNSLRAPRFFDRTVTWLTDQLPTLDPRELLPVSVEVIKAIVICGNPSTPNLLIADFRKADGTVGLVPSRSKYDLHKQVYDFKFEHISLRFAENDDYQESMTSVGERLSNTIKKTRYAKMRRLAHLSHSAFTKLWRRVKLSSVLPAPVAIPPAGHGGPLHTATMRVRRAFRKRQLAEEEVDYTKIEYAIERKLLEAPVLELSYYIDTVGKVPLLPPKNAAETTNPLNIGNEDLDPEWGVDVTIHGGIVRYGPWADRQRTHLQRVFAPPVYHDSQPSMRLKPGDQRVWTALKVFVEFADGATLILPFREPSKDWQWDGKSNVPRPKTRDPAYMHLRVGEGSSIRYFMPMVASVDGYDPVLEVHLDSIAATSSLNDIRLLEAESCRVRCEMPSPLQWRSKRQWSFMVSLRQPTLFLIRDHINMFTDLGKDWSTGPPIDFQLWIPMVYVVNLELRNYELNLYANDLNIIDKPLVKDDNALVTLRGPIIQGQVNMPMDVFSPIATTLPFHVELPAFIASLSLPRWNTHWVKDDPRQTVLAKVGVLQIDGSYTYFADVAPGNLERLELSLTVRDVVYKAFGWSIRTLMVLRDNYFGSFTHFSTLNEFLAKHRSGQPIGDPLELQYRPGQANPMHVELQVEVGNLVVLLPAGLSGYNTSEASQIRPGDTGVGACVMVTIPQLGVELRAHEDFMEMSLNSDVISGCVEADVAERTLFTSPGYRSRRDTLLLDGLRVVANRMFGPQPHGTTYVCIWELSLDALKTSLSATEANVLLAAVNAFQMNFADLLNAPATEHALSVDPDVTFLTLSIAQADIIWDAGPAAVHLSLPQGLSVQNNDWAGSSYRKVTSIRAPNIAIDVLLSLSSKAHSWVEAAHLNLDINLDVYASPPSWRESARLQKAFVEFQDAPTGRFAALFDQTQGRYMIRNGLYLARLQPPRVVVRSAESTPQHPLAPHERASPWPSSAAQHQQSESENEDHVSEAARDARVAQSRPISHVPTPQDDDEKSMSSGDESDSADLTDTDDSDDDELATADSDTLMNLAEDCHFMKKYTALFLRYPSFWEGSPFSLTRTAPKFVTARHQERGTRIRSNPLSLPIIPINENDKSVSQRTVIRVHSSNILVLVTPLLLPASDYILKDLRATSISPDIRIDGLMADYVKSLDAVNILSETVLDVCLSSMHLRLLQSVSSALKEDACSQQVGRVNASGLAGQAQVVTVIDFTLARCQMGASFAGESTSLPPASFLLEEATISLSAVDSSPVTIRKSQYQMDVLLVVTLADAVLNTRTSGAYASIASLAAQTDHRAPPHACATGVIIGHYMLGMVRLGERLGTRNNKALHATIQELLQCSGGKHIIDPLSTIQPSYLVQTGLPNRLRTDGTYKVLSYFRNSLSHLTVQERSRILTLDLDCIDVADLDGILALLRQQLQLFTPDADALNVRNLPIWRQLFPLAERLVEETQNVRDTEQMVMFTMGEISLKILDMQDVHNSVFTLGPVKITLDATAALLAPTSSNDPGRMTATVNPSEQDSANMRQLKIAASLGRSMLILHPNLMDFLCRVVRAKRRYSSILRSTFTPQASTSSPSRGSPTEAIGHTILLEGHLSIDLFQIEAAAENLIFVTGISGVSVPFTIFNRSNVVDHTPTDASANVSILFDEVFLRARSLADVDKLKDVGILASLAIESGKINILLRRDQPLPLSLRAMMHIGSICFTVPRSAVRLYRFAQEWRARFLPSFEATVNELLSEIRSPNLAPTPLSPTTRTQPPSYQAQISVGSILVALQVMHGTWLSWEVCALLAHARTITSIHGRRSPSHHYGAQIGSQLMGVSSKPGLSNASNSGTRVKVEVPTISMLGRYDDEGLYALTLIEQFQATIKPSHIDVVLSVQQKFGRDFDDLMALVKESWKPRETSNDQDTHSIASASPKSTTLKYNAFFKSKGFRMGLQAPSSILYLECEKIDGGSNNEAGRMWQVKLSDFALSLAQRSAFHASQLSFNRRHRSAFVIIDMQVAEGSHEDAMSMQKVLTVDFTKIHAVMQPSSIGEIGDFVDHIQADMLMRKEKRAVELADFREKTKTFMRSFEANPPTGSTEGKPWLHDYIANLTIKNIGVAFPLTHDQDLELPQTGSRDATASRAFLFSVKTLAFGAQRGESGQAVMKGFSFQFVSQFRLSVPTDYAGDSHPSRNRLLYPEMTAQLRAEHAHAVRRVRVAADVSGFILDVDSTLPDYVFSLIDVYRQGKEQVGRLSASASMPRGLSLADSTASRESITSESQQGPLLSSNIFASLIFRSGKVRLYSSATAHFPSNRTASFSHHEGHFSDLHAEVLSLPEVSVWGEYRASPNSYKLQPGERPPPAVLIFKCTVHSSQNTLLPTTLLPFMTEFNAHVERRMRTSGPWIPDSESHPEYPEDNGEQAFASNMNMQISLSLRIDQSKLELTCQPDVNVVAGVNWESGGFVVNIAPSARRIAFTGSVEGLTVSLRHGFLSEDCATLQARNLAFSAVFNKSSQIGKQDTTVSLVVDTTFSGAVRFSRLQDLLCFKAVWLDRIPVFSGTPAVPPTPATPSVSRRLGTAPESKGAPFTTILLIRLRRVNLDVDLGQSISTIALDLQDVVVRTKITNWLSEVSLRVGNVVMLASGNVSGRADVPDFVFETFRRTEAAVAEGEGQNTMLDLHMTSGPLNIVLHSEHQELLQYRAEPVEIRVYDDWSKAAAWRTLGNRQLRLSFTVSGTDFAVAVTVGTIPRLVAYVEKFKTNLEVQREGASRESKAFRIARAPKPDNPLSSVANAMLQSARTRFKEADAGLSYLIQQRMSLQLRMLRLAIFPRRMDDPEMAQFVARDVSAQLDRVVESDQIPPKRDLRLAFASMGVSKFSQLNHVQLVKQSPTDSRDWLTKLVKGASEANIFGLPSMTMNMVSEESSSPSRTLTYDFESSFARTGGKEKMENIYITLNVSLYSWLTLLRKNFAREMDEVDAAKTTAGIVPSHSGGRKRLEAGHARSSSSATALREAPSRSSMLEPTRHSRSASASFPARMRPFPSGTSTPAVLSPSTSMLGLVDETHAHRIPPAPAGAPAGTSNALRSKSPTMSRLNTNEAVYLDPSAPSSPTLPSPGGGGAEGSQTRGVGLTYEPRRRDIERLTMRQLGEATPDVMHPFFMKKAGFSLEDSLPQYVHEYATAPLEEIMKALLELYSKQLKANKGAEGI